jgi:hypothetical protein
MRDMLRAMRTFNLLNYAMQVAGLAKQKDRAGLASLRLRLCGAFDLYAL